MMLRRVAVVLALGMVLRALTPASSILAADPLWSRGGPGGASVTVLDADPQHPGTLFAGTFDGGIWKTTDGAAHWNPAYAGLPTVSGSFAAINAIAVDPALSSRVYAATNIGLFKSDNGGTSWTESGADVLEGKFLNAIGIDPASSSTVFAGTSSGVYLSTDAGVNWKSSNTGLVDGQGQTPSVESIAIDPREVSVVIAGTQDGVFGSSDGGKSWTKVGGTALDGVDVTTLIFDPIDPTKVLALSPEVGLYHLVPPSTGSAALSVIGREGVNDTSIFKEIFEKIKDVGDGCVSPCENSAEILFLPPKSPSTASLDSATATGSEILVATGRGVFHSLDGGASFTPINDGLPSLAISTISGDANGIRYAGSGLAGVAKTTDDAHWAAANSGLFASEVDAVATAKSSPSIVYAATGSSVFKSSDAGVSWQELTSLGVDQQVWPVLAVDPANPSVVYSATDEKGVIKTTNGGRSWAAADTGLTTTAIGALAIDPTSHATIFAGTDEGLYRSVDGATHWTLLDADLSSVRVLAFDPVSHQTMYAGTSGDGVYRSGDGGTSWTRISGSNGFVDRGEVTGIGVDPSSQTTVYVTDIYGIFKTSDGGASWTNLGANLPSTAALTPAHAIAIQDGSPSKIYVAWDGNIRGPGDGVYQSTDGGTTWSPLADGLENAGVQALALGGGATPILYAGTLGGGVFRSPPAAATPPPGTRRVIPVHPAQPKRVKEVTP